MNSSLRSVPLPLGGLLPRALLLALLAAAALAPRPAAAQVAPQDVITIARGQSFLLVNPAQVERLSIGDPEVADATPVSPREILINSRSIGTTTLIVWDQAGGRRNYTIQVTIDAGALERSLQTLFPGEDITARASGGAVVLTGTVSNATVARRAIEVAQTSGATVIDDLASPPAQQILLKVRFAEVNRRAVSELSSDLFAANPDEFGEVDDWSVETLSDGLVRLFLMDADAQLQAVIRALKTRGNFRSLAEPNLLALDGVEASFLAGGEFPVPVPQSGGEGGNVITIQFKEFGVLLRFTPRVMPSGRIRLDVAPEVSQLDFGTAIQQSGFTIPSFVTRRAETSVELNAGQTLAIAGLIDNSLTRNVSKIPFLGDIPILGALFQSRDLRESRTELLVLVTPQLVEPSDQPIPVPSGEPETWQWDRSLRAPAAATSGAN